MQRFILKQAIEEIKNFRMIDNVIYSGNLRSDVQKNKQVFKDFIEKYPNLISTCKELIYWKLHIKDSDFIDSLYCECGNRVKFNQDSFKYRDYCSQKCARIYSEDKIKETNLIKYGTEYASQNENIKAKQIKTFQERYGKNSPMEVSSFKEKAHQTNLIKYGEALPGLAHKNKIEQTNLLKYGSISPLSCKEVQDKIKETNLIKYGTESYLASEKAKSSIQHIMKKKYGCNNFSQAHITHIEDQNKEFITKHFVKNQRLDFESLKEYFNIKDTAAVAMLDRLEINYPFITSRGKSQSELYDFVYSLDDSVENNNRKILYPKELDLYIPNKNIAIEYDGLMYHSFGYSFQSKFNNACMESMNKGNHLDKTKACEDKNIFLFHVFENEWQDSVKREIWKSMIENALGKSNRIFARKTEIKELSSTQKSYFLQENHMQGTCPSSINLGLYYQNELVSIMTFGKPRFNKNYEWELLRFCNKRNYSVVGGANKLLAHFIKHFQPKSIISYANRRWSNGNLYRKLGFEYISETDPGYFYFSAKDKLQHRVNFQKHKLKDILEKYDPKLTETENMYENGYRKIYDCGNLVYALIL